MEQGKHLANVKIEPLKDHDLIIIYNFHAIKELLLVITASCSLCATLFCGLYEYVILITATHIGTNDVNQIKAHKPMQACRECSFYIPPPSSPKSVL